jgi:hypothetical protein
MSSFLSYAAKMNSLTGKVQQSSTGMLTTMKNIMKAIPEFIAGLAMFFSSIWVLALVLVVMGVIYYLWSKGYPRMFGLSHTENIDDMDQLMNADIVRAMTAFMIGTPIINFMTAKGPYSDVYKVSPSILQNILGSLEPYTNFHKSSTAYTEMMLFLKTNNIPLDENTLLKFFNQALKGRKQPDLKARLRFDFVNSWIVKHQAYFDQAVRVMDKTNMYTFIDFEAYEKGEPLTDRTIRQFGRLATIQGMPLGAILQLPDTYYDKKLVSSSMKEVATEMNRAHRRQIQDIVKLRERVLEALLKGMVVPRKEYNDYKISNVPPQSSDHPKFKVFHTMKLFENRIADMLKWFTPTLHISKDLIDTITGTYYYELEQLLNIKYDAPNGGNFMLLDDNGKRQLHTIFHNIVAQAQYPHYKAQIDSAMFIVLYWQYGHRASFMKNMMSLSQFYLSFIDLSTYKSYRDYTKPYREWRDLDGKGVWSMFTGTLLPLLWDMYIQEGVINTIRAWLNFPNAVSNSRKTWEEIRDKLSNHKTFLPEYFIDGPNASEPTPRHFDSDVFSKWVGIEGFSNGEPQKEHFLGKIFNPILAIMRAVIQIPQMLFSLVMSVVGFIPSALDLVGELIKLVPNIITMIVNTIQLLGKVLGTISNPMVFITSLFKLALYFICAIVILFLKLPFGNTQLGNVVVAVVSLWIQAPIQTASISRNVGLFAITIFAGFFAAQLDRLYFNGFLLRTIYNLTLACENSPNAWYETAASHKGNQYERKLGLCVKKCAEGYEPTLGGFWCKRAESFIPAYCPQALMMRVYKEKGLPSVYTMDSKVPFSVLGRYTKTQKIKMVEEAMRQKQEHHATCANAFSKYDHISKQVCRNMDMVKGSDAEKEGLEGLCKQMYCRQGKAEPFCYKLNDSQFERKEGILGKANVFNQMLAYVTLTTSLMVVLYHLNANDLLVRYP